MRLLLSEIDKRVVVTLNRSINKNGVTGIMSFGKKNDYPQVIERLILGSQTAKACVNIYSKFIAGGGFTNEAIGTIVVGKDKIGKPVTLDKIRRDAARSLAMYNGVYIHCNESLEEKVVNTKIVPFKNCRFSKQDAKGYSGLVAVHPNWEKDSEQGTFKKNEISWYNVFNQKAILENVKQAEGIENFKGQIYSLFFDDDYLYPLSPFDSVYLDMDTEYQVQLFKNREIRDGFADKIIMLVDPPDDETEREELKEKIQKMMGPDGGRCIVIEAQFDPETHELKAENNFKVEKISTTINDKLFENWEKGLANNIRKAIHALPAVLIDYEQGKLSQTSGETITQAVNYYNALTKGLRESFSELFKDIYSHFADPALADNKDWSLKPLTLIENGTPSVIQPAADV